MCRNDYVSNPSTRGCGCEINRYFGAIAGW